MTKIFPIMRSLDPYHARIGYLGALSTVATRELDRIEALSSRFHDLLFQRIYPDEPRFEILMDRVKPDRRAELKKRMERPPDQDLSAILSTPESPTGWLTISEFWLYDACMPSHLGYLPTGKRDRAIDLARWTETIQATLEMAEVGYVLHRLLLQAANQSADPATFNVLNPLARPCLPLLYLRLLLGAEMLFPFLVCTMDDRIAAGEGLATRGVNGLLRGAVNRMMDQIGETTDPEDILEILELSQFQTSIQGNLSTEENYLRPRLEILVDLGFVGRRGDYPGKRSDFMWEVTGTTRRLASEWRSLQQRNNAIPEYLDRRFFHSMAKVYSFTGQAATTDEVRLLWFARAYGMIGREFGFTPGRALALLACLMAWESGIVIEVGEIFDSVYKAAGTQWERFLHYSGGSRFDREFLIRIDEDIIPELERDIHTK